MIEEYQKGVVGVGYEKLHLGSAEELRGNPEMDCI